MQHQGPISRQWPTSQRLPDHIQPIGELNRCVRCTDLVFYHHSTSSSSLNMTLLLVEVSGMCLGDMVAYLVHSVVLVEHMPTVVERAYVSRRIGAWVWLSGLSGCGMVALPS
jgi:hypothetical protein